MKIKESYKRRLIERLESLEAPLGKFQLRNGECFCIMGHLCDIIPNGKWEKNRFHYKNVSQFLGLQKEVVMEIADHRTISNKDWEGLDGKNFKYDCLNVDIEELKRKNLAKYFDIAQEHEKVGAIGIWVLNDNMHYQYESDGPKIMAQVVELL